MAASTLLKDTLALGSAIIDELGIDDRGELLQRWMAHHLAETLENVKQATGDEKARLEAEAVSLILKLWAHRRALPETLDPLGDYSEAIQVLKLLHPDANPWRRFAGGQAPTKLLFDMFEAMSRSVVAALELTGKGRVKELSEAEAAHLEPDEATLRDQLEEWRALLSRPIVPRIIVVDASAGSTAAEADGEPLYVGAKENLENADPSTALSADLHATVGKNLRQFHTHLGVLIDRWESKA